MNKLIISLLLVSGASAGWLFHTLFASEETEKIHMTLEEATKQSKFNLVRDDLAEYFYVCEKKGIGINHWKALFVTGYSFQYGVDAKNISLSKVNANNKSKNDEPEEWEINVESIEVLSSELKAMKAFTIDKAWFRNQEKLISRSKDELIDRKHSLAKHRMYGDPNKKIISLLEDSIKDTIINLSKALDKKIIIKSVNLPKIPEDWDQDLDLSLNYQCGDINPIFEENRDRLKSLELSPTSSKSLDLIPTQNSPKLDIIILPAQA